MPTDATGHLAASVCEKGRISAPGFLLWGLLSDWSLRLSRSLRLLHPWDPTSTRHPELSPDSLSTPVDYNSGTGLVYDDSGFAVFPPRTYPQKTVDESGENSYRHPSTGRSDADGNHGFFRQSLTLSSEILALLADSISPWAGAAPGLVAGHHLGYFSVAGILNLLSCFAGALAGALLSDSVIVLSYSIFQHRVLKIYREPVAEVVRANSGLSFEVDGGKPPLESSSSRRGLHPRKTAKSRKTNSTARSLRPNNISRRDHSTPRGIGDGTVDSNRRHSKPRNLGRDLMSSILQLFFVPLFDFFPVSTQKELGRLTRTIIQKPGIQKIWRPICSNVLRPAENFIDWICRAPFLSSLLTIPGDVMIFDVSQLHTPYFRSHQRLCLVSSALAGLWAALGFGLSGTVWRLSRVGEPWALNNLMTALVLWLTVLAFRPIHRYGRTRPDRQLCGYLGFTLGLAACNQPTILLC